VNKLAMAEGIHQGGDMCCPFGDETCRSHVETLYGFFTPGRGMPHCMTTNEGGTEVCEPGLQYSVIGVFEETYKLQKYHLELSSLCRISWSSCMEREGYQKRMPPNLRLLWKNPTRGVC